MIRYKHTPTGAIITQSKANPEIYENEFGGQIASYYIKGNDWEEIKEIYKIESTINKDITEVRRLSDNQLYTIGDRLNISRGVHVIKEFKEINNQIVIHFNKDNNTHSYHEIECTCTQLLQNAHKPIVEALFNTNDNVPIYKNQTFYLVDIVPNYNIIEAKAIYNKDYYKKVDKTKYRSFSTRGTAQEWVKKNKPKEALFTTKDGVKIYKGDNYTVVHKNNSITSGYTATGINEDYTNYTISRNIFSTEQAAQKWVNLQQEDRYYNTPCLSINDVAKIYVTANSKSGVYKQPQALLNLVKQKLNNEKK